MRHLSNGRGIFYGGGEVERGLAGEKKKAAQDVERNREIYGFQSFFPAHILILTELISPPHKL